MKRKCKILFLLSLLLVASLVPIASAERGIELRFDNDHDDVYVKGKPNQFVPVKDSEIKASLTKPLYTLKGTPLGFTLGQWLAARATGMYTIEGDTATIRVTAKKLVPKGTYTLWCSKAPCGAVDGSENVFRADANGKAVHAVKVKAFPDATMIRVAYHSTGKTYGADPGTFGVNVHVQLHVLVPQR